MEARVTPEEYSQLQRGLMERTLDRAASDPEWKRRLLEDPQAAMMESGFPEAQRLEEANRYLRPVEEAEVQGHLHDNVYIYQGYGWGFPQHHHHHHVHYRWTDSPWS